MTDAPATPIIDPELYKFATDRQAEYLDAIAAHDGNQRAAAATMGVVPQVINVALKMVKRKAAKRGWAEAPQGVHKTFTIPDGYMLKGRSTYVGKDGLPIGEWIKTDVDKERQIELMKMVIESMLDTVPRLDALPKPDRSNENLLNLYTMTDCHLGMLAWKKEAGKDWDLKIAETTLAGCFAAMVDQAPPAKSCVVAQLGDWMHYDGMVPMTPTSGHILDADSRAGKMVATACSLLRRLIDMALAKHETVYVLAAEGNHDMFGSIFLRTLIRMLYENEPRVILIESENPYYAMTFGDVFLAWHHGHKKSPDSLPLLFASMFGKMWGDTVYRYGHTGDKHHKYEKEHSGITMTQHGTLAAADAYATRGGWMSHQYCEAITYHRKNGEAGRVRITPAMIDGE